MLRRLKTENKVFRKAEKDGIPFHHRDAFGALGVQSSRIEMYPGLMDSLLKIIFFFFISTLLSLKKLYK